MRTRIQTILFAGLVAGCGAPAPEPTVGGASLGLSSERPAVADLPTCASLAGLKVTGRVTVEELADGDPRAAASVVVRVDGIPLCTDPLDGAGLAGLIPSAPEEPLAHPIGLGASDPMPADGSRPGASDPMPADGSHPGNSDPMPARSASHRK